MYLFSPTLESEDYTENVFILAILPNLLRDMKKISKQNLEKNFLKNENSCVGLSQNRITYI